MVTASGERIGEVEEALINASGKVVAVTVDVSDSFGIGDAEVIIDLDKLRLENTRFVTDLNRDQIKALPKWDD